MVESSDKNEQIDLKNLLVDMNINNRLEPHDNFLKINLPFVKQVEKDSKNQDHLLAILLLHKPIYTPLNSFYIASRLELGSESKSCRMTFSGRVI
jgi:hypothetical protein